jgi:hypothetical protein
MQAGEGSSRFYTWLPRGPVRFRVSFYLPRKWRVGRLIASSPSLVTRGIGNPTYERDNVAC